MYICIYIYTSWNVGKGGKGQLGEMILPQELGVWYIYIYLNTSHPDMLGYTLEN